MRLESIVQSMLPHGSDGKGSHTAAPVWPPDVFAIAAVIAEQTGLYADPAFSPWGPAFAQPSADDLGRIAATWSDQADEAPDRVQELWQQLLSADTAAEGDGSWRAAVMELLIMADMACAGIGFAPTEDVTSFAWIYWRSYQDWASDPEHRGTLAERGMLPFVPSSLCSLVPPEAACVQPKTSTPGVGCTLRSFTHYLALLPPIGVVRTQWHVAEGAAVARTESPPLNILAVPFPYRIDGRSFRPAGGHEQPRHCGRFTLEPTWLEGVGSAAFAKFLASLVLEARRETDSIHGLILPETSLPQPFARDVAARLAEDPKLGSLELFITGTIQKSDGATRNNAALFRPMRHGKKPILGEFFQSKHHRWGLKRDQIKQYHLGHVFQPSMTWWEDIDVAQRECHVTSFRDGSSLTVLVCEDLARHDPVLPALSAIGPNLVIALLMDGPQLEARWPGRYATALADDPGSAVLTLTSLGMVKRCTAAGVPERREIALWKEPGGRAETLSLARGHHALLLTLSIIRVEQRTVDGRSDDANCHQFHLTGSTGIKAPDAPSWATPD